VADEAREALRSDGPTAIVRLLLEAAHQGADLLQISGGKEGHIKVGLKEGTGKVEYEAS